MGLVYLHFNPCISEEFVYNLGVEIFRHVVLTYAMNQYSWNIFSSIFVIFRLFKAAWKISYTKDTTKLKKNWQNLSFNSPQIITTEFIELATIHFLFVIKLLIFKHFGYEHNLRDGSCKSTHLMQKIDSVQCHWSNFKLKTVLQK